MTLLRLTISINMAKHEYMSSHLITYIGNKRKLVKYVESEVSSIKEMLGRNLTSLDGFSGSGVVARMLKYHSDILFVNDMESYSYIINQCYLSSPNEVKQERINKYIDELNSLVHDVEGVVCKNYAPKNTSNILKGERVFYTKENALIIDTIRKKINDYPPEYFPFLIAPLLIKASIHTNTSGVFKGFHKKNGIGHFGGKEETSAQSRITKKLILDKPIYSDQEHKCKVFHYNMDINELIEELPKRMDVVYLDPPYNQHPYGSNYFMLNTILNNEEKTNLSKVSGIPKDWQKSNYNYKSTALDSMRSLLKGVNASYIILSYNDEGIITKKELIDLFDELGFDWTLREIEYQTYRGSRNLKDRKNKVMEYLWILHKLYDIEEHYCITSIDEWGM
jgi:adenine-specific DNA-methyltransferase